MMSNGSMDEVTDRTVAIAGGAGLIGREICRRLAENDYNVVILDSDIKRAMTVTEQINASIESEPVSVVLTDITSEDSVTESILEIDKNLKSSNKLCAVVNCSYPKNSGYGADLFDVKYQDFCENVNLHLGGYFLLSQKFAEYFRSKKSGVIINIASIYGFLAPRFEIYNNTSMTMPVEYAAIKSSILHLTRYFAKYLKGSGVRVNAISPGGVEDGQPIEFINAYNEHCSSTGMVSPNDVATAVLFLLSDGAACINGQNIIIDDGFSL